VSARYFQESKDNYDEASLRDAPNALNFTGFDEIDGFYLLDDRTEKQNLTSAQWR
jgi:hypothetical protein